MNQRVSKDEQIRLIMECRNSGLSDYQWCEQNGVHAGTFYNWVSKLKKKGYTFPDSAAKTHAVPVAQEVVKVDLIESDHEESIIMEQNATILAMPDAHSVAVELILGNITLKIFNGADDHVIQKTLQCIGGLSHAW